MNKKNVYKNNYKLESAGFLLTKDFISLKDDQLVENAIHDVRKMGKNMNNIHYVYIVDEASHLKGVLSLRELIVAPVDQTIGSIMKTDVISVPIDLDQELVAQIMQDHDFVSLPVLDKNNKMIGVIHVENILDVVQEEATEDFHKIAPVTGGDINLSEASVWTMFKRRAPWLIILVFMNIFSGAGIAFYEETIEAYIALVFFLPLLVDSGGNAGSQSATLMIRSMAIGDVRLKDWFRLLRKEVVIAGTLGIAMGLAVSILGVLRGGIDIAVVVSLTMMLIVIVGSAIGMSLPFLFSRFKMDPATASAPLITSICDITGVLIYFSIATWYLGIGM